MRCAECGAETTEVSQFCLRCGAPVTAHADPPGGPSVAQARQQAPQDARVAPADSGHETADAAGGVQATVSSVPQPPPIRTGAAFTGAATALFAGVVGLIAQILLYSSYAPAVSLFGPATYLLLITVAIVALVRINRLLRIALLQGMWWPAVAFVASDIVSFSLDHAFGLTGRFLAGYWTLVTSDVLGAAAVLLLVVSWSPAVDRAPRFAARLTAGDAALWRRLEPDRRRHFPCDPGQERRSLHRGDHMAARRAGRHLVRHEPSSQRPWRGTGAGLGHRHRARPSYQPWARGRPVASWRCRPPGRCHNLGRHLHA